jgi:hypothetical protein
LRREMEKERISESKRDQKEGVERVRQTDTERERKREREIERKK